MGVDKFRRKTRFKGRVTFESTQEGARRDAQIYLTEATVTLLARQSGRICKATKASATQTFTLPAATAKGAEFTFVCGHASGEILINPGAGYKIKCKATNDAGASVAPAAGTGIKNTAATNIIGDYITLVADGVDQWDCVAQSGIWASQ